MKKSIKITSVFLLMLLFVATSSAQATTPSSWTKQTTYGAKTGHKFVFGLRNALFGWTEIFTEPIEASDTGDNPFLGLGKGLWNFVGDTIGGVLHIVTFPIPVDVPLPEGGTDF